MKASALISVYFKINSGISLGLVQGHFITTWIYIVSPIIGAFIAVIFEFFLKGRATDTALLLRGDSPEILHNSATHREADGLHEASSPAQCLAAYIQVIEKI